MKRKNAAQLLLVVLAVVVGVFSATAESATAAVIL